MCTLKYFALILVALTTLSFMPEDWGPTGHRATGAIAETYLTKKKKKEISDLLDGQSLAFVSTYADEIRSDDRYKSFAPWHYVNFPFDSTYANSPKSPKGDIMVAIDKCLEVLKTPESSKDEKTFYLKLLVHFMGDLHQPLHVGLAEDKGGNTFQVQWFDEGVNLHWVWDEKIIEKYGMSYSELAQNTKKLTNTELEEIQKGTLEDWMYESRTLCMDVYAHTKVGEKLGYQYMYRYTNTVRDQIQKAGIRLAKLLNGVFE